MSEDDCIWIWQCILTFQRSSDQDQLFNSIRSIIRSRYRNNTQFCWELNGEHPSKRFIYLMLIAKFWGIGLQLKNTDFAKSWPLELTESSIDQGSKSALLIASTRRGHSAVFPLASKTKSLRNNVNHVWTQNLETRGAYQSPTLRPYKKMSYRGERQYRANPKDRSRPRSGQLRSPHENILWMPSGKYLRYRLCGT